MVRRAGSHEPFPICIWMIKFNAPSAVSQREKAIRTGYILVKQKSCPLDSGMFYLP